MKSYTQRHPRHPIHLKMEFSGVIVHSCHLHYGQSTANCRAGEDLVTRHRAEATIS